MITRLLTRTDGSAGGVKSDKRPAPNRRQYWPADELNNVLDAVTQMLAVLGLSDGSTVGSVLRKLRSFSGPREATFVHFDDFVTGQAGASPADWTSTVAAGGTAGALTTVDAAGGVGVVHVTVPAAGGASAHLRPVVDHYRGSHLLDVRFRFRTPASMSTTSWWIGIADSTPFSYARLACNASATLRAESSSLTGGGSGGFNTATALAASTWYEGRIRITADQIAYYINDALVYTETTATRVPDFSADQLSAFAMRIAYVSGAGALLADWYEVNAQRP
jgi:hypothetical protein